MGETLGHRLFALRANKSKILWTSGTERLNEGLSVRDVLRTGHTVIGVIKWAEKTGFLPRKKEAH